eukprot:jgi/Orpsp1_1/1177363/evm.model.c7180000061152.1
MEIDLYRIKKGRTDVQYFPLHQKNYVENKNNYEEKRKKGVCFLCKQPGHLKFNCPNRIKPKGTKGIKRIKADVDNGEEKLSLRKIKSEGTGRKNNIIDFYISTNDIGEIKAKVLIDSGADMNFIHPSFAKYAGIKFQTIDEPFGVSGLGYGISKVKKETEKCMLRHKNHLEVIQLYSLRIPDVDIILGLPWIEKHSPTNYHNGKKIAFSSGYCARHCNNGKRRRKPVKKNKGKEKATEEIRKEATRVEVDNKEEPKKNVDPESASCSCSYKRSHWDSDSESEKEYYFKGRYVKTINDSDSDFDYESDINDSFMFDSDSEFSDSDNESNKENTCNNSLNKNENSCNKIVSCRIIKNINKDEPSTSESTPYLNNDFDNFSLFSNCENLSVSDEFKDSNEFENLNDSDHCKNFLNCVNFDMLKNSNNSGNCDEIGNLENFSYVNMNENLNKNELNYDEDLSDFEISEEFEIISDDFDSNNYEEFYTIVNCNIINKEKGCKNIPIQYLDLREVFNERNCDKLPPHREYDCEIKLKDNSSLFYGPLYSLTEVEREELKKYLEENLKKGFIRKSTSPAGAPILFVKKKDGSLRLCIDYRKLNDMTIRNSYPLPLIGDLLDRVKGAKIFTKLDLKSAYNLVRIKEGDEHKTAFRTRYCHYEYLVMPFGLKNAPATFQHFINDVLSDYLDDFVISYIDDILIYSKDIEEHHEHVRKVLKKLLENNLFVKLEKCEFDVNETTFLGYVISNEGIKMDKEKVKAILDWPIPKNVKEIQSFIGLCNYYRLFIKDFAKIANPLHKLTRKNVTYIW